MKVVTKKELLAMPSGVIFSSYTPISWDEFHIFYGPSGDNDFVYCDLNVPPASNDCGEHMDLMMDSEKNGTDVKTDLYCTTREGLYDASMKYIVWSEDDIKGLVGVLTRMAVGYDSDERATSIPATRLDEIIELLDVMNHRGCQLSVPIIERIVKGFGLGNLVDVLDASREPVKVQEHRATKEHWLRRAVWAHTGIYYLMWSDEIDDRKELVVLTGTIKEEAPNG